MELSYMNKLTIVWSLVASFVFACGASNPASSDRERLNRYARLATEISEHGGPLKVGESGDKSFVSALRILRDDPSQFDINLDTRDYQKALARLGDDKSLQEIYCEVTNRDVYVVDEGMEKLKYVGGWFSIDLSRKMLDMDSKEFRKLDWSKVTDSPPSEPREYALDNLDSIIPKGRLHPDLSKIDTHDDGRLAEIWKEWIKKNEIELVKLEPRGLNVDRTTGGCKGVRIRWKSK